MITAYDKDLRKLALQAAVDLNMSSFVREGVYVHVSGPNYETPSESIFLRNIGADAVGMSTAPEVTVARHLEIKVLGELLIMKWDTSFWLRCGKLEKKKHYNQSFKN